MFNTGKLYLLCGLALVPGCMMSAGGAIQNADQQWKAPSGSIKERAATDLSCDASKVRVFRVKRFRSSANDIRWAYNLFHVTGCGKGRNYLQGCSSRGCGLTLSPEMDFCLHQRCPLEKVRLTYIAQGRFMVEGCRARRIYLLYKGMWITRDHRE